ncbi:MAG TPA: hypothetical protein VMM18_10890 [Gemmatimonadaceae bacterium]|nr:hypothetical protein [Gemmatimonadaceae bacterium]
MAQRTVTDDSGRTWIVRALETPRSVGVVRQGRDVTLACTSDSVPQPVKLVAGWQWERMAPKGLARMIVKAMGARTQ